jgi:hypothetical protein
MWRFDPVRVDLIFAQTVEEVVDGSLISFEDGTDLSIDMGSADNNGVIDQGNVINGTV